jgi:hypothetical protein
MLFVVAKIDFVVESLLWREPFPMAASQSIPIPVDRFDQRIELAAETPYVTVLDVSIPTRKNNG